MVGYHLTLCTTPMGQNIKSLTDEASNIDYLVIMVHVIAWNILNGKKIFGSHS